MTAFGRSPQAVCAIIFTAAAASPAAAQQPLFTTGAETSAPGETRPPQPLVRFVVRSLGGNDARMLDDCLRARRLGAGAYRSLLRVVRLPAAAGRRLWFMRPSRSPWCPALYGAHLFRYFLVEERAGRYRLVFRGGGDAFAAYARRSRGLNDIETTGCNAGECWTARWSYDGVRYRPSLCTRETFGRRRIARRVRCPATGMPFQLT